MKLGEILQKILNEYPYEPDEKLNKPFPRDDLADFMRNQASDEFTNIISTLVNYLDVHVAQFSPGKSQWVTRPWGGIRNSEVSTSFQNGFYIVYHCLSDRKRVILTLNQANDQFTKNRIKKLEDRAKKLKKNLIEIPESFSTDYDTKKEEYRFAAAGNILSKIYDFDDLNNEELLLGDLNALMKVYNDLIPIYKELYINNTKSNDVNVWLLSPGENAAYWDEFKKNNIITIGWGNLGDLNQFGGDNNKILNALEKKYPKKSEIYHAPDSNKKSKQTNNAKALLDFSNEMKIGDIVFIKKGINTLLGVGIITSDYKFSKESKIPSEIIKTDQNHFRYVKWLKCGEFDVSLVGPMPQKTLTNITNYPSKAYEGLLYYQALGKLIDFPIDKYINIPIESEGDEGKDIRYGKEDFLQEVVFLEKNYNQLLNLIKRKKNIILQGPPGVGKSFIAKKIAYSIMGCKDYTRVQFIQFHQSYSYEDFIQGFRPVKDGFDLKNGVFYSFCRKAQDDQNNDYYFIIDEINRGNISKIFGELMMLIEEDKRGKEFAIHLTYSDKDKPKFFIPDNVYVIGMMNTADRSLAMIDYALRRRFVFYSINPLFEEEDIFKNHLINIGLEEELAKKIISRFKTLNQKISEDDSLGDGFKIGHSYFCGQKHVNDDHESENDEDWYNSIINYEIAPLLKEYWFDNLETAQEEIDKLNIN